MLKCSNCGANIDGNKCEYCGAVQSTTNPNMSAGRKIFFEQYAKEQKAFMEKSPKEQQTIREKNRLARVAIHNGKCPDCGTPFSKIFAFAMTASCRNCGASINEFSYMDKF